ncbi:MAG: hypothetical protein AAF961_08275, partial [Planctomycetota bacterium]
DHVRIHDVGDGLLLREFPYSHVKTVAFSPDGRWLAMTHGDRTILHATADWNQRREIVTAEWLTEALEFAPDSNAIATSDADLCVNLWDVRSARRMRRSEPLSDLITALFYSPQGDRIGAVSKDGTAYILDADTLETLLSLPIPSEWTFAGGFSPDGNRFVVGVEHVTQVFNAGPIEQWKRLNVQELREIVCGPLADSESELSPRASPHAPYATEASAD